MKHMLRFVLELVRGLRYFVARRRIEAELHEEMDTHFAMLANETDPVSASRRLGNATRWREKSREVWGWNWLESLAHDVSYGSRLLLRSPGFTATACLSLAMGLGATMGVFSLMNALLFKTLPVPKPNQLWELWHNMPEGKDDNFAYRIFTGLQRVNSSSLPLFAVGGDNIRVNYGSFARNSSALIVSGNAFRILRMNAYIGRLLTPEDDIKGVPHGANCVLSYRLWQSQFHGDPGALGQHLSVGAQSFTIVGVAPRSFFGFNVGSYSDLILPIAAYAATNPAQPILESGGWTWLNIMSRAPSSAAVRALVANLNTAYPSLRKQIEPPAEAAKPERLYAESVQTGVSAIRDRFSKPLYVLLTMTGFILLIACANLANLLLARSVVRYREIAIRLSIGAHRGRILRQLLTESALIGVLGGCAGIPVYFACTAGLIAFLQSGSDANIFLDTRPDWRFIAGVVTLLFSTVLLFGFVPALRAVRTDLNSALSEGNQRLTGKTSFANAIVAVQISLSLVLLLGATLLARSLFDLRTFNPGFRRDHLLVASIDTTQTIHKNADVVRFFNRLLERVRALPGTRSAAASVVVPLSGQSWQFNYEILDRTGRTTQFHSYENWVDPQYFKTLGTSLILGRGFNRNDSANVAQVALVNQTFAARAFGSANPVGRQVHENGDPARITIVGIVGDARYRALRDDAPPTLYRPIAQLPPSFPFLLTLNLEVWSRAPAADLQAPIERLIKGIDSQATVDFHTFGSIIDSDLLYERLLTGLSVTFGLIGLFLSATGVYGLSAYSVSRRTAEFGIRMALGASPGSILRLLLSEQIRMLVIALVAGFSISLGVAQLLQAWLFHVSATDPFLYSAAGAIVGLLAMVAALVPARRAARLNPLTALRCE